MNPNGYPLALPMILQQGSAAGPREEAPARVRVALQFLSQLAVKEHPLCAVNDQPGSIEWRDGLKPTTGEEEAGTAACELLAAYFRGTLPPTAAEKAQAPEALPERAALQIQCMACAGHPRVNPDCRICRGCGEVLVYPAAERR